MTSTGRQEANPNVRRVRPSFADDVYASMDKSSRLGDLSTSQQLQALKNDPELEGPVTMSESALAQRRSAHLPKLKEICNQPHTDSADFSYRPEMTDLDFVYADCDTHGAELSELYTYSEIEDWALNVKAFRSYSDTKGLDRVWSSLSENQQKDIYFDLIDRLESAQSDVRLEAARIVLYLFQGAYLDFVDDSATAIDGSKKAPKIDVSNMGTGGYEEACLAEGILNTYKAYSLGMYQALCTFLMVEINDPWDVNAGGEQQISRCSSDSNSRSASNIDLADIEKRQRKGATMADNEALRVVLSALYHMVESIRRRDLFEHIIPSDRKDRYRTLREDFLAELEQPIDNTGTPLVMVLFEMMPAFCRGHSPHFPMKKVLLLIWKVLLAILGDWKELREKKSAKRIAAGLLDVEDTLQVASVMKASSISEADSDQAQIGNLRAKRISSHPSVRIMRQLACTSNENSGSADDDDFDPDAVAEVEPNIRTLRRGADHPGNDQSAEGTVGGISPDTDIIVDEDIMEEVVGENMKIDENEGTIKAEKCANTPTLGILKRPNPLLNSSGDRTPIAGTPPPMEILFHSSLPWKPKVRGEDIEAFLQHERLKFFDYELPDDSTTVFGLPAPIHGSVDALRRHIYISLGELQAKREKDLNRYPFSIKETEIDMNATEKLYQMMLPNLSQYVIALLKVLLNAAPSSKVKNDAINILCDVLTPETDNNEVLSNSINCDVSITNVLEQSVRVAIDVNRHKEIMVKAASSILILLMKHFRLNHIYQFEYLGQHLVFANCIPLILKFLDQNMVRYVQSKHELTPYNYPHAPLYYVRNREEWPSLNIDNVDDCDLQSGSYYLWRNVFSAINLLRVLNKLTKWKHARTMLLVVFKSAPILKRSLRVKVAVFQLYVLKLLKMQARYLGRQWRRSNMEIMSSIYSKVRHRLNDDWAYANESRSKSCDFQNEEAALKTAVEKFNSRRYSRMYPTFALDPSEGMTPGGDYLDNFDAREYEPVDDNILSVLGIRREMSERFKRNYEKWLVDEVIKRQTNWDNLLLNTRGIMDLDLFTEKSTKAVEGLVQ
ncbi:hypothetical protein AB6A40_000824 [Gnathostoma spinigerum]|uniref:Uncharacterized protein n=1 Tax=Gnathostoma spinigerum TaxID=75299 RepID=A0ABD6ECS4_9BILA